MPSILNIRVSCARDLPVMDRASELADAYVEIRFGDTEPQKSGIARRTLNPVWNHQFRLEIANDLDLQNEPLEIRVIDWDSITSNDQIGAVLIDLDPLLSMDSTLAQISGWFPLFDTLRGIRGEVYVSITLHFFGDSNPFKDSSAGVQFFTSTQIPPVYNLVSITGLVDALTVADDPEYHWADSFRTPRSSNDARQKLMYQLSNQLRRLIGKKCLDLGANAIVGYRQCFDLENYTKNIVARAIGTACVVAPINLALSSSPPAAGAEMSIDSTTIAVAKLDQKVDDRPCEPNKPFSSSNSIGGDLPLSTSITIPPLPPNVYPNSMPRASYPNKPITQWLDKPIQLTTLTRFATHSIIEIAGLVTAKSIKLLTNHQDTDLEISTREQWWTELREEVKLHAKNLHCTYIFGYRESATIHDDLIILSVMGTAANFDLMNEGACRIAHLPYPSTRSSNPDTAVCQYCNRNLVPEMLLSTADPPVYDMPGLEDVGGCGRMIQAHVIRPKKKKDGELNAALVSEALPFIEFDLHRQISEQLAETGMNAVFGVVVQIALGDEYLVAVASGTGFKLPWMHPHRPQSVQNPASSMSIPNEIQQQNMGSDEVSETWIAPGIPKSYIPVGLHSTPQEEHSVVPGNPGFLLYNCAPPLNHIPPQGVYYTHQLVLGVRQVYLTPDTSSGGEETRPSDVVVNRQFAAVLEAMYAHLANQNAMLNPCILAGVSHQISMIEGGWVQIQLVGTVMGLMDWLVPKCALGPEADEAWEYLMDHVDQEQRPQCPEFQVQEIQISPLPSVPYTRATAYLGRLSLTFVKEITEHHHHTYVHHHQITHPVPYTWPVPHHMHNSANVLSSMPPVDPDDMDGGGMGAFVQVHWIEIMAVVNAHVRALNGNALVAFSVEHAGFHPAVKGQMYAMVCVSGDVCHIVSD